ncbi:MAG: hypothetical protein AAB656_03505 [Patescibacteria group bacterium]
MLTNIPVPKVPDFSRARELSDQEIERYVESHPGAFNEPKLSPEDKARAEEHLGELVNKFYPHKEPISSK